VRIPHGYHGHSVIGFEGLKVLAKSFKYFIFQNAKAFNHHYISCQLNKTKHFITFHSVFSKEKNVKNNKFTTNAVYIRGQ